MNENKSNISYEVLIEKMNEKTTATKTIKVLGENIEVKQFLTAKEFDELFARIIALIYTDGEYNPAVRDFVIRICTVFAYTSVEFPSNIEEYFADLYMLMYNTNFYDSVVNAIDDAQYSSLLNAVSEMIRYRNNTDISRVNSRIEQLIAMIEGIGGQFNDMLAGVSEEDINKLINAIQDGGIDEKKLVMAYAESKAGESDG